MKRAVAIIALVACMAQQAGANNLYERYIYYQYGKPYYGYRAYAAPKAYQDNHSVTYNYHIQYAQPAAIQGKTVYGLTDLDPFYGNADIGELFFMSGRLAESSQKYADKATSNFSQLIAVSGEQRARVAEIQAKGNAAAQALHAANAQASASIVTEVTGGGKHTEAVEQPVNSIGSIQDKCLKCHGGKASGGGDVKLPLFSELTAGQADAALEYVTLEDDRNCADKAKLTGGERKALVKFLCPLAAQ
jgi:hypothetical protein